MPSAAQSQPLNMALGQLITNEVLDTGLLNTLTQVPRQRFLPQALAGSAYVDEDLPLGGGRFLIAPLSFARMLQLAAVQPHEKVLVVGCAMGYSLAVLSRLAGEVVGCEESETLAQAASKNLDAAQYPNVRVEKVAKLTEGFAAGKPYDVIFLEGSVETVPESISQQLADGGRLITAERVASPSLVQGIGLLVEYAKIGSNLYRKEGRQVSLPPLPGFERKKPFVF